MSKGKWNFIIDAIMFVLMAAIAGLGLLIKYVLLPGTERWIKYGRSVDLTFWGLDRHDWGRIHLILALVLVALLALHIILHWKLTICLFQNLIKGKKIRIICTIFLIIITVILVIFPFFIRVDVYDIATGRDRFFSTSEAVTLVETETKTPDNNKSEGETSYIEKPIQKIEEHEEHEHHNIDPSIEVKGSMTLSEISQKYKVPEKHIKSKLKLPSEVSGSDQLGHLRKQYGFKMSEIELIISNYKK
ncbi:MAG: DUF4405 domain-containing protein [Bacteroidales bacterium]|nr:DUF4405 domain-containing protein [Bacteroidales bacterium]